MTFFMKAGESWLQRVVAGRSHFFKIRRSVNAKSEEERMKHKKEDIEAAEKESTELFCPILRSMISRSDAQKIGAAIFLRGILHERGKSAPKREMAQTHTPGPWRVRQKNDDCFVEGNLVVGETFAGPYRREILSDENYPEKLADCRLVAMAPELLEENAKLKDQLEKARKALEMLEAGFTGMFGHQSVSPWEDAQDRGVKIIQEALKELGE